MNQTPIDKEAVITEWNKLHQSDGSRDLDSKTVPQLRLLAQSFGLSESHVKVYGNTTYKKSWQAALRIALVLYKSTSTSSESMHDSSDEERDSDDAVSDHESDDDDDFDSNDRAVHALHVERAQLEKEKHAFELDKKAYAVTVEERTQFENEKATFESEKRANSLSLEERIKMTAQANQFAKREQEFIRKEKDFAKRQANFEKHVRELQASVQKHKNEIGKKDVEIRKLSEDNKKRKRVHDRAISDVTRALKRLKGETYWSYSPPSSWTGADVLLWNRYRCKSLVGGHEFSSDHLRVNGRAPKWRTASAVREALCAAIKL